MVPCMFVCAQCDYSLVEARRCEQWRLLHATATWRVGVMDGSGWSWKQIWDRCYRGNHEPSSRAHR